MLKTLSKKSVEKFNEIEWAPISIPMSRRLQTFIVGLWMFWLVFGLFICLFSYIYFLFWGNLLIRILCILYLIHIVSEKGIANAGGKGSGSKWARDTIYWEYLRDYFPVDLIKTADLPANRNYLFAIFPHGVLSCAAFANFVSFRSKFREYFPGIRTKILTLNMHFNIPVFRELMFAWGLAVASANCIKTLLTASNDPQDSINSDGFTSNAAILFVGGAQEALYCRPRNYQIVLKKRKGFIKMTLLTGASLVPVFSFGEVDVFDQVPNPPGSFIRHFQEFIRKLTGISPVFFNGRGFFQYTFGIIPRRRPITTVVGAPIDVVKNENPTNEEIEKLHSKFIDALVELFEKHKGEYIENSENVHLVIE